MNSLITYDLLELLFNVALLLTLASLLGVGSIILRRVIQALNIKLYARHRELFVSWVINYVYSDLCKQEHHKNIYFRRLSVFKNGAYPRLILIEVIHNYYKYLTGDYRESLLKLYDQLDLTHQTFKKIRSNKLECVMNGIREIRDFNIPINSQDYIYLLKHPISEIREEAFFVLSGHFKDPITTLFTHNLNLSEWQKIQFYDKIKGLAKIDVPDLSYGLDHASLSDRLFLLDLIGRKDLQIYFVKLLNMLQSSPQSLQRKTVDTLVQFGRKEAIPVLTKLSQKLTSKESKEYVEAAIQQIRRKQNDSKVLGISQLREAS